MKIVSAAIFGPTNYCLVNRLAAEQMVRLLQRDDPGARKRGAASPSRTVPLEPAGKETAAEGT